MAIMWVVQPPVHEVIDVITVRYAFVAAIRTMRMRAPGPGRTAQGVGVANFDNVFVDMISMRVMQMTIMQVIDMAIMAHSRVPTVRTMLMCVFRMTRFCAGGHGFARLSSPTWLAVGCAMSRAARSRSNESRCEKQMALARRTTAKW